MYTTGNKMGSLLIAQLNLFIFLFCIHNCALNRLHLLFTSRFQCTVAWMLALMSLSMLSIRCPGWGRGCDRSDSCTCSACQWGDQRHLHGQWSGDCNCWRCLQVRFLKSLLLDLSKYCNICREQLLNVWWSRYKYVLHMPLYETHLNCTEVHGCLQFSEIPSEELLVPQSRWEGTSGFRHEAGSLQCYEGIPLSFQLLLCTLRMIPISERTPSLPFLFLCTKIKQGSLSSLNSFFLLLSYDMQDVLTFLWKEFSTLPLLEFCKDFHWIHRKAETLYIDSICFKLATCRIHLINSKACGILTWFAQTMSDGALSMPSLWNLIEALNSITSDMVLFELRHLFPLLDLVLVSHITPNCYWGVCS